MAPPFASWQEGPAGAASIVAGVKHAPTARVQTTHSICLLCFLLWLGHKEGADGLLPSSKTRRTFAIDISRVSPGSHLTLRPSGVGSCKGCFVQIQDCSKATAVSSSQALPDAEANVDIRGEFGAIAFDFDFVSQEQVFDALWRLITAALVCCACNMLPLTHQQAVRASGSSDLEVIVIRSSVASSKCTALLIASRAMLHCAGGGSQPVLQCSAAAVLCIATGIWERGMSLYSRLPCPAGSQQDAFAISIIDLLPVLPPAWCA